MTPRLRPLIIVIAAGCASPKEPPPKTADLVVPPMPASATPAAKASAEPPPERKLSYEEALADSNAQIDDRPPVPNEPDMTDAQLMGPMRNAAFISGCGAPDSMKVTVKVAVLRGRAIGVTIWTNPQDESVARCVDEHVRQLRWPVKQKMDSFTSTY